MTTPLKARHLPECKATTFMLAMLASLTGATGAYAHANAQSISDNALVSTPEIVECTLDNGDSAQCARYVVKYLPDTLEIGPFCPSTLDDVGGIWQWDGDEAGLYRIDGDYLKMLEQQGYTFFNEDGEVYTFDIRVEGPTEAHECIQGSVDPEVEMTVLIPINPVMADTPATLGTVAKIGIGLDGVPIFADAPSVLDTGHMPALDTCGGHVDPGGWYHWHATASGINTVFQNAGIDADCTNVKQDPTAQFGYAFDGFAMFGPLDYDNLAPEGLDACGGHVGPTSEGGAPVYHYHAGTTFPNLPTCLVGVVARDNFTTNAAAGIGSANSSGGPGGRPDFSAVAETLGVDADLLSQTLENAGGPNANLSAVAETLGVSVEALQAALPKPNQ